MKETSNKQDVQMKCKAFHVIIRKNKKETRQWEQNVNERLKLEEGGEFKTKTLVQVRNQPVHLFVVRTFQGEGRTSAMLPRQEWDRKR